MKNLFVIFILIFVFTGEIYCNSINRNEVATPQKKTVATLKVSLQTDTIFKKEVFDFYNKAVLIYRLIFPFDIGYEMGVHAGIRKSTEFSALPYIFGVNTYAIWKMNKYISVLGGFELFSLQHPQFGGPNTTVWGYSLGTDIKIFKNIPLRLGVTQVRIRGKKSFGFSVALSYEFLKSK